VSVAARVARVDDAGVARLASIVQGLLDPVTPRNPSLLLTVRLRLQAAKSQIRHKWFI
jgi:hypothetical protein